LIDSCNNKIIYIDDKDLLTRKQNFLAHRSVNTPEALVRRRGAAKQYEGFVTSLTSSQQARSSFMPTVK
jgi:hypothetical protein